MRAREFIFELDSTTGTIPSSPQTIGSQPSGTQDPGKLTAMISGLQKQVQDLQKSALQTSAATTSATASPTTGPAASTINPPVPAGGGTQPPQTMGGTGQDAMTQNGVMGKPVGAVQGLTGQNAPTPAPVNTVPGVNQSPQVTNMKIKQQLAQNQGRGT